MWKIISLSLIFLLTLVIPAFALNIDQINSSFREQAKIKPIQYDSLKESKWDKTDTILLILRIIDWGQTKDIASAEDYYYWKEFVRYHHEYEHKELNPILGEHPSQETVDFYFTTLIIIDYIISRQDSKLKKWWRYINIGTELWCINANFNAGIRITF